jgi:hypothetical protein
MVCDSDLQSLSVVSIVFGDTPTMNPTLLLRPPPLQYPKTTKVLKMNISSEKRNFCSGGVAWDSWILFCWREEPLTNKIQPILARHILAQISPGPQKLGFWHFSILFSTLRSITQKLKKLTIISCTLLKSWLKNLSNEYIYAEENLNRTRDICFQSWPFHRQSRLGVPPMFWLWG